jgi:hypothetical protein
MAPNIWGPRTIKGSTWLRIEDSNFLLPASCRVKKRWTRGHWIVYVHHIGRTFVFSKYGQLVESREKSIARGRRWPEVP